MLLYEPPWPSSSSIVSVQPPNVAANTTRLSVWGIIAAVTFRGGKTYSFEYGEDYVVAVTDPSCSGFSHMPLLYVSGCTNR